MNGRDSASIRSDTESYARDIVEAVREPLLVLDPDLRVEFANPSFFRTFKVSEGDTLGRPLYELGNGQWDIPDLRTLLDDLIPEQREIQDFLVRHRFERIGRRTMLLNARQLRSHGEVHHRILLAIEDITQQRRAESKLRHYAHELERSNRELEQFAHAASHDLQEPLRKIQAFADRLETLEEAESLSDRARDYLDRMTEAAGRMRARIDDLLQLGRIGREGPRYERIDLGELVETVLSDLEISLEETGARIDVGDLPTIEADPELLRLLFQNLLSNAIKYRKDDVPLEVQIRAEPVPAEKATDTSPGRRVRLVVEDNGIGFEPEYAERIFEPFQRLHGRARYDGSGVGLTVCRKVVEGHAGTIDAHGRPGEGARFTIILPRQRAGAEEEEHEG